MLKYIMNNEKETIILALPTPGKEMEWKRSILYHRNYDNGKRKLIESASAKIWKGDYETPTVLEAFDPAGEGVFGRRGIVIEGESDGWKFKTKARRNGLPVTVVGEKVGKRLAEILYEGFVGSVEKRVWELTGESDADPAQLETAIEHISQELHIDYDKHENPIKKTTFQEVELKAGQLFTESRLFAPVEETVYHYDDQGRIYARADYEFGEDDQKKLSGVVMYEYQQLEPNRVRAIERNYSRLRWREIQDGAAIFLLSARDFDPRDGTTLAYAVYNSQDKREKELLTAYKKVKRNPLVQTFIREEPPAGTTWTNYQYLPESIPSPSFLTGDDVETYLKNGNITKIGTPGDKERAIRILFPDEFAELVGKSSDEELFTYVSQLLSGDMVVELGFDFSEILMTYQRAILNQRLINPMQRVALVSSFLPAFAFQINHELLPKSQTDEIIGLFIHALAIDAEYRTELRLPPRNPRIKNFQLTAEVIKNLEQFSDIVIAQPEAFGAL
jgi:hypothetical protein